MSQYFVGIEGGATSSSAVVLDENGNTLATILDEPPTNHWNCGIEECCNQIVKTIKKVKIAAEIQDKPLSGVGLCLSGCEEDTTNESIKKTLLQKEPNCGNVVVASDTVGPLYAVSKFGGVVLIAGTGSNCLLINPDKSQARCGGWSYMIGDEGSAFWIAHRAMKYCIDVNDNYQKSPHDTAYTWNTIKEHFNVKENADMLHHWYQAFNKPFYAKLTMKLVEGARNGDKLCQHLFYLAGEAMAKHLLAIRDSIDPTLHNGPIGLPIVCVGSVFKSWDLLKTGFTETLGIGSGDPPKLTRFSVVRLTVPSALGAALLAAPSITSDYSKNLEVIYSHGL